MPNSNGRSGFGRRSGTVTVIEEPVRRSVTRTAKIVAIVVFLAVSILATIAASSVWEPIIALFAGVLAGLATALIAAMVILAWPVIRVIWWWAAEIITATALVGGWVELAGHTTLPVRVIAVAGLAGVPAAIPAVRKRLTSVAWCLIIRHRLRTCFSEFIITNRTGSLPLIMWALPTPVGVRVWIWLRPGLALDDIQQRLDLIAVACWSSAATAEAASQNNAAHIRMDIKRGNALTGLVSTPLTALVSRDAPSRKQKEQPVPTALDLPDVAATDVAAAPRSSRADTRSPAPVPAIRPAPAATGDDVEDWI